MEMDKVEIRESKPMKESAILIMEADETLRAHLQVLIGREGYKAVVSVNVTDLLRSLHHRSVVLVILGSSHKDTEDSLEIAQQLRLWHSKLPILLLAHHSSEALAIAALKAGVNDYFPPPFDLKALQASMARWLAPDVSRQPVGPGVPSTIDGFSEQEMIGDSPVMRALKASLDKVAATDSNVLITGETGTGKELVTRFIHRYSPRRHKPLVCINCAAIPDSLLESELFGYERGAFTGAQALKEGQLKLADGGTVFFDEIGDMSLYAQAKILRAIESKEVFRLGGHGRVPLDIRIIAATNRNLHHLMQAEHFRTDLYFRLNVASINLPPLRERKEDIPALVTHYLPNLAQRTGQMLNGFTHEALAALLHYEWPGNVRELKNLLEATLINHPSAWISVAELPESFRKRLSGDDTCPQDERERVLWALHTTNWQRSVAAQKLQWSRMTLYRKMVKYQIAREGRPQQKGHLGNGHT
jgi:DNA-binding NtrC family response regulator